MAWISIEIHGGQTETVHISFFFKRMFQNTYNSVKTTTQKYSVFTNYSVCMMFLTIWNAKSLGLCLGSFSFVKWLSKLRNGASVCLIY